jgi:hypothetical protein
MTTETYQNALRWLTLLAYGGAIVAAMVSLIRALWIW